MNNWNKIILKIHILICVRVLPETLKDFESNNMSSGDNTNAEGFYNNISKIVLIVSFLKLASYNYE